MFRATFVIAFTGLFTLLLMPGPPPLRAQAVSIATVTGRVTDEQGAIVPGANIKITKIDTGTVYASASNGNGIYTLPSLPIGEYQLEAIAPGFQTYVQSGILLRVNDSPQINIVLKVGQVTEKVEVHANADLVQTQQNTISQVVDQQRIVELPLNGRDATQLITISGASVNHSDGTNTGSKSFFSSQSISIAGSAGNETNYLLDGGDNNDSFTNVNMPFPFPDALAEFSVETSTLPARNGLHPGGVVNAVTKSGSNSWHGDLFEFIRNGDVNAINYFAPKQDSLKGTSSAGHSEAGSSATSSSSSAVISDPTFARTHRRAPRTFPRRLRSRATSVPSMAPAARQRASRAPLSIQLPETRCRTSRFQ